ncbi:hypothetical protein RND71_017836 [Anisodus tanguticus]|uniref:Uncharacterized protein n=1 Tax=Anisodus tanguticus TaxID=243964 RepID=A0AAE1S342_9SOLA|nr:hypothetical protein RND71_017836 [Anisodus tanguticus]
MMFHEYMMHAPLGLVLYNNLEALRLFPIELLIMGELKKIKHEIQDESDWYSFQVVLPVALSLGLLICMFGGVMYQQSTSNKPKAVKDVNPQAADEEQQKLLEMQSSIQSTENEKQATTQSGDEKQ